MTIDVEAAVERKPACCVKLNVKASPSLVSKARKEAIKKINKEASIPGFRPGKAPEDLVVRKYPFDVERAWHKAIADASFVEAQRIVQVPLLNNNTPISFDLKSHSLETGAELSFSFETEPVVPTVDPKEFVLKEEPPVQVEEKQLEEAIHQARYYFAEWVPVVDRGICEGDAIMIDLEVLEEEPRKVFDHVRFEVSATRMAKWMQNLVLGAKAGDCLEGLSEPDADASEEEKKEFAPKRVRVTIHKVEIANLPEVNDEFAKKLGASDVEAMRTMIRVSLEGRLKEDRQDKLLEQVSEFLIMRYDFDLPFSLIETERDHRRKERQEYYDSLSEEERKKFDEELFIDSSKSVRAFYLARQIIRDAKIPISHVEIQQEAVAFARSKNLQLDPTKLPKGLYAVALSRLMLRKAQQYVLENCTREGASSGKENLDPQENQQL